VDAANQLPRGDFFQEWGGRLSVVRRHKIKPSAFAGASLETVLEPLA
jgi:hypothetical protein